MNLFLTSGCNERCAFCYAERWFERPPVPNQPEALERVLDSLRAYGALVKAAPPMPEWGTARDEEERSLYSSRCVNLLGGEPTIHPHFERVVREVAALGLGVIPFTNGSMPERLRAVKEHLWAVVVNGHFAERAPSFGVDPHRVHANLPLQPGVDLRPALEKVRDAGIKTLYLAFAAPAGGEETPGAFFTPDDLQAMKAVHEEAMAFCAAHEIFVAYDCSFPVCVDERVLQAKCTSVPVMDPDGFITICGGEYFHEKGKRHISTFSSLREVHAYTFRLISGLRALPSRFAVCNGCEHFNRECHGMCLAYRERPGPRALPLARGEGAPLDRALV